MTKTLIGMAILAGVAIATPAGAQDRHHGWRNGHDRDVSISVRRSFARDRDCRVRVIRTVRPNGTVVIRRIRRCD